MTAQFHHNRKEDRRFVIQYAVLTSVIIIPLLFAFARIRNTYPIAVWNVMMAPGEPERSRAFFILRGETVAGDVIELRPLKLTNALYSRTWGLVTATANNDSFKLPTPHPLNLRLLSQVGGLENLPAGARVPDLLEAWGQLYNQNLKATSPDRLRAISLDMYRWDSGRYADYNHLIDSWRKEL